MTQVPPPLPASAHHRDVQKEGPNGQSTGHGDHDHAHDPDAIPTDLPKVGAGTVIVIACVVLAILGGLFFMGYLPHAARKAKLAKEAEEANDAKPLVQVVSVKRAPASTDLNLPADARANQTTAIYPRANGYLKKLLVDIGDRVKEGQLLAEIDTPEVDAQLAQARAAVQQAEANLGKAQNDFDLAKSTLERYAGFAKTGGVTQQQLDEKQAAFAQAKAALDAGKGAVAGGQADVKRLEALASWQKVTAPFDGTVTARNYDVGALLQPSNTAGKELFRVEQTDVLRVNTSVPQQYATLVKLGQEGQFYTKNYPGKGFPGVIKRTAGSIDPQTRTLRVEVEIPNTGGVLYAGMYGQVKLTVTQANPPVRVPTSALVYNAKGTRVALVNDGRVSYREIQPGRDFGQEMEVASGLTGGEWVIANPGERLSEGLEVDVAGQPGNGGQQGKAADAGGGGGASNQVGKSVAADGPVSAVGKEAVAR